MGGAKIDTDCEVINTEGEVIPGLAVQLGLQLRPLRRSGRSQVPGQVRPNVVLA